jgi:hypothetical protein
MGERGEERKPTNKTNKQTMTSFSNKCENVKVSIKEYKEDATARVHYGNSCGKRAAEEFIHNYFDEKNKGKKVKVSCGATIETDRSVRKDLFKDIYEDLEASLSIAHKHKNKFKLFERYPKSLNDGGDAEILRVMKDSIEDARHLYHMAHEDLIKYCKHTRCMFGDVCTYMHPCNYNNLVDAYGGFRVSRDQLNLSLSLSKPEKHIFTDISNFERSVNLLSRVLWFMVSRRRIGLQLKKL